MRDWLFATVVASGLVVATNAPAGDAVSRAQDQGGPVTAFYGVNGGPIDPFYGPINPFFGGVYPSYGQISPFWGSIRPFWGAINPFYGSIRPFYRKIDPFWGGINPFSSSTSLSPVYGYWSAAGPDWGNINTFWNQLQSSGATDYSELQAQLNDFVGAADSFWGARAQKIASKVFAKYGIDRGDPASLASASAETRAAFFLNYYDRLMDLTGLDRVDWWMAAVHWSPALVKSVGTGTAHAGVLDAWTTAKNADVQHINVVGGYAGYVNDHGAAVASVMAALQDNVGAMGVAPNTNIYLYNPFDTTGTADWTDVTDGIDALFQRQSTSVVNASLGVPGWTLSKEWGAVLNSTKLNPDKDRIVLVKAAGNEGVTQTTDIAWPVANGVPNNLVVVGSVGPTGKISQFSNRPGEACLLLHSRCREQNKLKYRFLVAPGELMLVEDNHGGTTRMTGTSFSAPLVSGTIALIESRWPWLKNYASETVQIVLHSADDLGAPGVDSVYGWGMLNVEAAMSPLNLDRLIVFQPFAYKDGVAVAVDPNSANWKADRLKTALQDPARRQQWEKGKAFLVAYEKVGTTDRDFLVPLSSKLVGKSQTVNGVTQPFQSYIYQRMLRWANGN
ncbi:MAG TPA: S8 family serine peptidase [Rhizomicrobium sp.]